MMQRNKDLSKTCENLPNNNHWNEEIQADISPSQNNRCVTRPNMPKTNLAQLPIIQPRTSVIRSFNLKNKDEQMYASRLKDRQNMPMTHRNTTSVKK